MAQNKGRGFTQKNQARLNTKWINNALKSVGSITKTTFSEYSPNLVSAYDQTSEVLRSVKDFSRGKMGTGLAQSINNNKYVKTLNTAYKNALEDIKSGKFDNSDRVMESMMSDSTDAYTVGDEDTGDSSLTVNLPDQSSAFASLSTQIQRNTEAQIKMTKASMDASIAVSTANMMQMEKLGSEINLHLSNIENSLSSIVQFNMNNMQRFMDASIAYYEKTGSMIEAEYGGGDKRIRASDIFASKTGGINLSKYKQYVIQQFKDSPIGGNLAFLTDDQTLKMLAANPLGTVGSIVAANLMPKVIKNTLESVEEAFSAASVRMLDEIGRLGDRAGSGLAGQIMRGIADTFGLKNERRGSLDSSTMIKKGATPFDGVTKHAITEVITKELREQTQYLKIIANHYDPKATSVAPSKANVFDYTTGRYTTPEAINKNLAESITKSIRDAFNSGSFGRGMSAVYDKAQSRNISEKDMNRIMDEFYSKLERSRSRISSDELSNASNKRKGSGELNKILRSLGTGSKTDREMVRIIIETLRGMKNNRASLDDFTRARFAANSARSDAIANIQNDPYSNNFFASTLFNQYDEDGNMLPIDEILDKFYDRKNVSSEYRRYRPRSGENAGLRFKLSDYIQTGKSQNRLAENAKNNMVDGLKSFFKLDYNGLFNSIGHMFADGASDLFQSVNKNFFTPMKSVLFGTKGEGEEYSKGGLFSSTQHMFVDLKKSVVSAFTGNEWKDSSGKVHKVEKPEDSVMGMFHKVRDNFAQGLTYIFTGEKNPEGKNAKPVSIPEMLTSTLKKGFDGWSEVLFGKNTDDLAKDKDQIIDKFSKMMPKTVTGGAIGGAVGLTSGGLLGTLVGGPVAGTLLGLVTGFASNSEKFQEWFFGKSHLDENGNKVIDQRGLIPENVQKLFKENKISIATGGTIGAVGGAITGGGLLGTLVGGPIAGAVMGVAGSLVAKSDMFQEFLYGDPKTGQRGLFTTIGNAFKVFNKNATNANEEGSKILGMSVVGAGTGALTAAVISKMGIFGAAMTPMGPLGGALLGLGATILAQKDNFHDWLFGKKNDKGEKIEEGVFGRFANGIKAHVINPLANTVADIVDDAKISFKYEVLDTIRYAAEPLTEFLFGDPNDPKKNGVLGSMVAKADDFIVGARDKLVGGIGKAISIAVKPLTGLVSGTVRLASKAIISTATAPFKLINIATKALTSKIVSGTTKLMGTVNEFAHKHFLDPMKDAGKKLLGLAFNGVRTLAGGVAGVAQYGLNKVRGKNSILDAVLPESIEFTGDPNSFADRWAARRQQRALDEQKAKQDSAIRKQRTKNEKFIYKWTNGQYVTDTEEARAAAIAAYNAKNRFGKQIRSEDDIKAHFGVEALDQKKNATATGVGMAGDIHSVNDKDLPWEGKTYKTVNNIYDLMRKFFDPDYGRKEDKENEPEASTNEEGVSTESKFETFVRNLDNGRIFKSPTEIANDIAGSGGLFNYFKTQASGTARKTKNTASKLAKKIAEKLHLPGYASGTSHAEGLALTGENGPELAFTAGGNTAIAPYGGGIPVFITGLSSFALSLLSGKSPRDAGKDASVLAHTRYRRKSSIGGINAANSDTVTDDGRLGNSADEIQNRIEDAESDQARMDALGSIAENTRETKDATIAQKEEWSSIFGKKGLITVGLIGLGLLLTKWLSNSEGLLGTLGNLISAGASGAKYAANSVGFKATENTRTNGESFADTLNEQLDRNLGAAGKVVTGNVAGGIDTFVTGTDGKWDHQSNANLKFLAKHGANLGVKGYKVISKVGNAVVDSGKFVGKVGSSVAKVGAKVADNIAGKVGTAVTTVATDAALGNIKSSSLIAKAATLLDDGFKLIVNSVNKTLGTKVGTSIFGKLLTKLKDVLAKGGTKVTTALSKIFGKETAASVAKAVPVVNGVIIAVSAVNGLTGAARLFKVNKEDVDLKMRAISSGIAALTATLPGTIIDVVSELMNELIGFDLLGTIAVMIYNALSDEEDEKKLSNAQMDFQDEYKKYQEGEIEKSYNTAVKDGTIDKSVTLDQYKSGVESGKYEATYMSFEDYNDKQNKSYIGKLVSNFGTIGKGIIDTGKAVLSGDMETVLNNAKTAFGQVVSTPKNVLSTFNESRENAKEGKAPKLAWGKYTEGNPIWWIESTANMFSSLVGTAFGYIEGLGGILMKPIKSIGEGIGNFFGGIKDFIFGVKDDAEEIDKDVKNNKNGGKGGRGSKLNGFAYYSQNDPRWANTSYTERGGRDPEATIGNSGCGPAAMGMVASQLTGKNYNPVRMARFAQMSGNRDQTGTNWRFIDDSSNALGLNSRKTMNPSAKYIQSQLNSGHPMILSGRSIGGRGAFTRDGHYVVAVGTDNRGNVIINDPRGQNYSGAYNLNSVASETGASWSFGGRGEEYPIENGAYYYTQKDNRWASNPLTGFSGTTIGSSGCVMTSAAMGASSILGTPINPGIFNSKYGNGNVGSTNFDALGLSVQRINGANGQVTTEHANAIISALQAGKPVMLFGQKEQGNIYYDGGSTGKGKNHCVLATGLDSNGNIIVNDPVQSAQNKKKSQSFTLDQLYPINWSQTMSGVDGNGISSNLKSTGMANSYYTSAGYTPNTAFNNVSLLNTDIKQLPNLSLSDINNILLANWAVKDNSIFTTNNAANSAKGILQAQKETGVSAIVPLSIGALESGWGTSRIAREKGNLWGWQAYNSDPYGSAATFGDSQYGAFKKYTDGLLQTYYNGYQAHTLNQIGTGDNPAGKGYAYNDNGTINKSWPASVESTASRMIKSINGTVMPSKTGTYSSSSNSTTTGSNAPDESEDKSANILSTLGNFVSEFASRAVTGLLTGKYDSDYSNVFNPETSTPDTEVTEDNGGHSTSVKKVKYLPFGGRGTSPKRRTMVNYNRGNLPTTNSEYVDFFGGGRGYGAGSSRVDDLIEETLKPIVPLLRAISQSTSTVADKISNMNNGSNLQSNNTVNNNNVTLNNGGNQIKSSRAQNKKSLSGDRNGRLAEQIAHAG